MLFRVKQQVSTCFLVITLESGWGTDTYSKSQLDMLGQQERSKGSVHNLLACKRGERVGVVSFARDEIHGTHGDGEYKEGERG